MQYRNRYINVGMLHDAEIAAGGPVTRDLAYGLILIADDLGRFKAETRFIHREVFVHMDGVSLQAARKSWHHLVDTKYVVWYRHEGREYAMIRNWHRFQPQKVERVRWSSLPAPPEWDPDKFLPSSLLIRWKDEEKKPGFAVPPISTEWISGARLEPWRETERSPRGTHRGDAAEPPRNPGGTPRARRTDKGKNGRTEEGRVDEVTRGDIDNVSARDGLTDLEAVAAITSRGNGGPTQWSDWPALPPIKRRIHLTNWLCIKHGWQTVKPDTLAHEHAIADHIAQLAIDDGDALHRQLEAWWDESDPDDRPSSLEFFWTRLQQLENERLKQQRPHVQLETFTRVGDSLPDIRRPKGKH